MLLVGAIALVPALAGGSDVFACRDAAGNWVFGNVEQDRCVGRVQRQRSAAERRSPSGTSSWAGVAATIRAIESSSRAYKDHVRRAAQKYSLAEELLHAVMAVESGYRERAVSEKGAKGLMQLMPGTARDMYVSNVWSPEQNIDGGARYLRTLANKYDGDLAMTLAAYNAGPEAVKRAGGVPRYAETQDYVKRVLAVYEKLKSLSAKG